MNNNTACRLFVVATAIFLLTYPTRPQEDHPATPARTRAAAYTAAFDAGRANCERSLSI